MRNAAFLLILGILQAYAVDTYSQKTKLSLDFSDTELIKVLDNIEVESEFFFLYNEKLLDTGRKVNIEVDDQPINTILDNLFAGTNVKYTIIDRKIILAPDFLAKDMEEVKSVQQQTVTGKVTDSQTGEPMPGVNILIKGTTIGTTTDVNGLFTIDVPDRSDILVFSFIGYKIQEIPFNNQSVINVALSSETLSLEEVVVVGYGTQIKRDVTGSMSVVQTSKIKEFNVGSVSEALVGMTPGVKVSQITGAPGASTSIRIRGVGSITAGNEPLYVIDGFPIGDDALSNFNMNDIESISILKDASSTAIYGSRGANGVILITTKRGKSGAPKVTFDTYYGFQKVTKKMDILSPDEFVEFATDAVNNAWEYLGHDKNDPMSSRPTFYQIPPYYLDKNSWVMTDWYDEIFRDAPIQNTQLSVIGGTESIRYKINGSYFDQTGIIKNSDFKRYTLGINMDVNITKKLILTLGLNSTKIDNKIVPTTHQWNNGVVATAISLPGFFTKINEDGSYPSFAGMGYSVSAVRNPMVFINEYDQNEDKNRVLGNVSITYDIIKGLSFKSLFGFDNNDLKNNYFQKSFRNDVPAVTNYSKSTVNAIGGFTTNSSFNWLSENTLNYNVKLDNIHSLNFLVGMTAQKAVMEESSISATNFPDNLVPTLNAGQVSSASTTISEWSMLSYLSRINYGLSDKYFISMSIRADGSSRFGGQNRWGYFPSVSVGWIASEEQFLKNISAINYLKIRASYGLAGNNSIPNYGAIGLLSYSNYVIGGKIISGLVPSTLSNANLGWEASEQINAGVELGLWKDRIKLVTDIYQSISEDLLLNVPVPSILGVTSSLQNIGKVRNRGLEFSIVTQNLSGRFDWTTDFNISFNRNKVLALGPSGDPIRAFTYQYETNITQVGRSIGDYYGYVFEGVYNTQEEIDNHPHLVTDRPGDPIVKDVNNDGQITVSDKTVLGNYQPDFLYGMTNTFTYRNFDLSVFIQGVYGNEIMNLAMYQIASMTGRTNQLGLARDRWRSPEEPGNGKVFKASIDVRGVRRDASSFYIYDGSYLRIRNITLGYNFNPSVISKIRASDARIYLSTQNPFTFDKYVGYNPEISSYNSSALTPGVDYFGYPLSKNLILGISVTF